MLFQLLHLQCYSFPEGISSSSTLVIFFIFPSASSREQKKEQQWLSEPQHCETSTIAPSVPGYLVALIHSTIKPRQMALVPRGIHPALCAQECDANWNVKIIQSNSCSLSHHEPKSIQLSATVTTLQNICIPSHRHFSPLLVFSIKPYLGGLMSQISSSFGGVSTSDTVMSLVDSCTRPPSST